MAVLPGRAECRGPIPNAHSPDAACEYAAKDGRCRGRCMSAPCPRGDASVIWRANHSAVGCRVTANHNSCRRPWPRIRNAKSCSRQSSELQRDQSTRSRQRGCERRSSMFATVDLACTMYFETVDWAISKPSFRSSPWICGAPQSGFSNHLRIRSRTSLSTAVDHREGGISIAKMQRSLCNANARSARP